jgi:hypothetical protein
MRALLASLLVCAVLGSARSALASDDPRVSVDWAKLFEQSWVYVRHAVEQPVPSTVVGASGMGTSSSWLGSYMGAADDENAPWVVFVPRLSLVARDWRNARMLSGDVLALTDKMRVTGSSRMVLGRVYLGGGRIAPFAQLGAGQWRVDRDIIPNYACDQELAAQLGFGVESKVSRIAALALETDYTVLLRDASTGPMAANLPAPRFMGVVGAARFSF